MSDGDQESGVSRRGFGKFERQPEWRPERFRQNKPERGGPMLFTGRQPVTSA